MLNEENLVGSIPWNYLLFAARLDVPAASKLDCEFYFARVRRTSFDTYCELAARVARNWPGNRPESSHRRGCGAFGSAGNRSYVWYRFVLLLENPIRYVV